MTVDAPATLPDRAIFILRLWREEGESNWRGQVQHVTSGQIVALPELEALLAVIYGLAEHPPAPPADAART